MSFPKYEKYKDSGVEWLGEVPEHWSILGARHLGRFSASGIDKKSSDEEVPVRMVNFIDVYHSQSKIIDCDDELMETTAPLSKAIEHSVSDGDMIITPSSEDADDIGHAARIINAKPGVVYSYHVLRYRVVGELDPAFAVYFINSEGVRSYFSRSCTGTTRMTLDRGDFKGLPVVVPPISEQSAIAAFLDHETAKIDALVDEQRRLIELLKEKRQAVISHAVTKGLNPDAPMKDSGVEWLGEVPEHWEVKLLKRFKCLVQSGPFGSQLHAHEYVVGKTPIINPVNLVGGVIEPNRETTVDDDVMVRLAHQRVRTGDIVFSRRGELGRCAIVTKTEEGWLCGTGSMIVRLYDSKYEPEFLKQYLSLRVLKQYFERESIGAIMDSLSSTTLLALPLVVPPQSEQRAVIAYVMDSYSRIDSLVHMARMAIDTLQERRTALISAAVTGKIDVRNHAPTSEGVPA